METLIAILLPLLRIIAIWCASVAALAFAAAMTPGAHIRTLDLHLIFGTIFLVPGWLAALMGGNKREDINPNEGAGPFDDVWTIVFMGLFGLKGVMALIVALVFFAVGGMSNLFSGKAALMYAANPISALFLGFAYIIIFCILYMLIKSLFQSFTEDNDE